MAARSKAWVCGRSIAGNAGSNPTRAWMSASSVSVVCCQVKVSVTGRSLVLRSPTECVCVCVSLSVIRCNNNPLHLRRISRKVRLSKKRRKKRKKERKKEGRKERKKCFVSFCFACLPGSHFRDCKQRSAIPC